ncbi:FG-GAP-like repeat-containing protein [Streptomyces sp. NPDC029721]|uniref:FG-GAP-like repeat-containing protein n=1 Tax=Streptomyces sp. NPDC029721 TaxID=3157090 RepID=UPI0033C5F79D
MSQFKRGAGLSAAVAFTTVGLSLIGAPAQALQGPVGTANHNFTARILIGDSERGCTGALVSPRWVLTAASCFAANGRPAAGKPPVATTVTVGRTDLAQTSTGAVRTAVELVPHPDRDLVLVKLNTGVAGVQPVAVATTPVGTDQSVTAAGFGRTKTSWVPDVLHTGSFTATGNSTADVALTPTGDAVICQGDAGGPVLRANGQTQELVAVASRSWQGGCLGTPATETRTGAIATRVDDVRTWITGNVTPVPGDMDGDNKPDMVAVVSDGKLRLYPGTGTGGLSAPVQIGSGGWRGAQVTHRGDWTGDGVEDLVAIVGGELRVYPNLGDGTLAAPVKIGTLPTSARIVGVGDVTRDGQPDLAVAYDDKLWIYPGIVGTTPKHGTPVQIGNSGWNVMTLTAPGDANHDGRPDLLARDTRDGILYVYLGQPDGSFDDRTEFGRAYTTTSRPLIAGAADANRDGVADMWATAGDGTLKFYKGGADIHGPIDGPSIQVGESSWDTIQSIS